MIFMHQKKEKKFLCRNTVTNPANLIIAEAVLHVASAPNPLNINTSHTPCMTDGALCVCVRERERARKRATSLDNTLAPLCERRSDG